MRLRYTLDDADLVDIVVYDAQGKQVDEIFNGHQQAGTHELLIDGSSYTPGMYFGNVTGSSSRTSRLKVIRK